MRSPPFMTGALIIGFFGATALGIFAGTSVPTQITAVEDTWRDRYGSKDDLADDVGSQGAASYALADNVRPAWLFNPASVPADFVQSDNDLSYNDYAISPDSYDYSDSSGDEPAGAMTASDNAEPQALEDGPEAAARSADQVALEVRELETASADAQPVGPAPNSAMDSRR